MHNARLCYRENGVPDVSDAKIHPELQNDEMTHKLGPIYTATAKAWLLVVG